VASRFAVIVTIDGTVARCHKSNFAGSLGSDVFPLTTLPSTLLNCEEMLWQSCLVLSRHDHCCGSKSSDLFNMTRRIPFHCEWYSKTVFRPLSRWSEIHWIYVYVKSHSRFRLSSFNFSYFKYAYRAYQAEIRLTEQKIPRIFEERSPTSEK
jgi:hypothetical protein